MEMNELRRLSGLVPPVVDPEGRTLDFRIRCRQCGAHLNAGGLEPLTVCTCPVCNAALTVPQYFAGLWLTEFCPGAVDNYVYKGYDPVLERDVAVKISKAAATTLSGVRLLDNARTLNIVDHAGVMKILDGGTWNNYAFCVMPWLEKGTLAELLTRPEDERFTLRQTMQNLTRLAGALVSAAKRGFGHYDINPGNILISAEWMACLNNFRRVDEYVDYRDDPEGLRRFDGWRCFSPELLTGGTPGLEDDIFSFGVTVYWLLSGRSPFDGVKTPGELLERQQRPLDFGPLQAHLATTPELTAMLAAMLSRTPGDRPKILEVLRCFEQRLEAVL